MDGMGEAKYALFLLLFSFSYIMRKKKGKKGKRKGMGEDEYALFHCLSLFLLLNEEEGREKGGNGEERYALLLFLSCSYLMRKKKREKGKEKEWERKNTPFSYYLSQFLLLIEEEGRERKKGRNGMKCALSHLSSISLT